MIIIITHYSLHLGSFLIGILFLSLVAIAVFIRVETNKSTTTTRTTTMMDMAASSSPTTTEVQQEDPKLSAINGWHSKSPINSWKHSMKLGLNRSHWDDYRQIRDKQIERYVFETNKLLIRLDRLMAGYASLSSPMDIDNRRRHEQSIVEWLDERSVPLCPSCACKFNII